MNKPTSWPEVGRRRSGRFVLHTHSALFRWLQLQVLLIRSLAQLNSRLVQNYIWASFSWLNLLELYLLYLYFCCFLFLEQVLLLILEPFELQKHSTVLFAQFFNLLLVATDTDLHVFTLFVNQPMKHRLLFVQPVEHSRRTWFLSVLVSHCYLTA